MARSLGVRGQVVVTLGADGALVVDGERATTVPAAAWASRVAAVTVTRPGATASLLYRHEIPAV